LVVSRGTDGSIRLVPAVSQTNSEGCGVGWGTCRHRSAPRAAKWKLRKINVSESMLSFSLPISLHARRSPWAAGRLDRQPKCRTFASWQHTAATWF